MNPTRLPGSTGTAFRLARTIACLAALCGGTAWAQDTAPDPASPPARAGLGLDDRRPEDPFTVDLLGRPIELTGSWEITDERRRNFDLDRGRARDRQVRQHEIKLEARTRLQPDLELFVQAVGLDDRRRTEETGRTHEQALERGQTWVRWQGIGGSAWDLQAGRVGLIERRAWWWDDDLDAVRVTGNGDGWRLDTGIGRELMRVSSAQRGVPGDQRRLWRWFGQATWPYAKRQALDAFWLVTQDGSGRPAPGGLHIDEDATDPSDLNGRWFGLRSSGEWRLESKWRLAWWLDTAWLRGRESVTGYDELDDGGFVAGSSATRRVRGRAVDLGATVTLPFDLRPTITLAHARGSGGTADAGRDDNFRQTGLHENKSRFGGVKRVQRYGELLQPELSNLRVTTLGAGLRFLDRSSLELIGHRYRQVVPSGVIAGSRLSADPAGNRGDIGREIDVVLALREWRHFDLVLRWSRFTPGDAFAEDERDPATAFEIDATFNF